MPYEYYLKLHEGRSGVDGVETAIPICLGDSYEGYRVVGTTPELFDKIKYMGDQSYDFAEGRNIKEANFTEAVIGATVARKTGLKVGSTFRPTHDVSGEKKHKHKPFDVVGVLKPTGTPNDRALFVNIEGFYRQAGHIHPEGDHDDEDHDADHHDEKGHDADEEHEHEHGPIPDKLKKVTAVLVCRRPRPSR